MYLQYLELTGFKSFAQKTILEFPKPATPNIQKEEKDKTNKEKKFNVTVIVGPNGSGKSNCAESIRWALGEQSIKNLRGKKASDIIFSGSKEKMRLNLAEVVLSFNNEDGICPIDYKEFTITRRLYRNGENEYFINKGRVRLQDILILLAKTNFGQRSYSIIGQGTIDQILISSPLERKKFFDEATGIKQYQIKKDIALRKLEKSRENLKQAGIALNEIIPHLHSLSRQINKLARRKQIEAELQKLQKKYYGDIWQDLKKRTLSLKKDLQVEIEKQKELEKELAVCIKESKKLVYEEVDESYQKMQQEYQKFMKTRNEYLSQQSTAKMQLILEEERNKEDRPKPEIMVDTKKIFADLKDLSAKQQKFIDQIKKFSRLDEIDNLKTLAEDIFSKINQILGCFQSPTEIKNDNLSTRREGKIREIKKQTDDLEIKIGDLDQKMEQINEKISQFGQKEKEKRKELFEQQNKIQEKQSQLNRVNESINRIQIESAKLETKKEDLEQEIKNQTQNQTAENLDLWLSQPTDEQIMEKQEIISLEEIQKLRHQLEFIGGIDPEIEKEYPEVKKRYEFLSSQSSDLKESLKSLNRIIDELNLKIKNQFKKNLSQINEEFDRYFKIIFNGGKAKIIFQEPQPISELPTQGEEKENQTENPETKATIEETPGGIPGIDIFATPPGKKIKSIEMLSGGEKALTALSLICAIISINKPPFVVLDEVDAALDQENSFRFAKILEELKKHTQFIIITHNQQTLESADILYGVSMGRDGISKVISLKLEDSTANAISNSTTS